jgi:DNA (cytosine-5)-methyltransferase 1
MSMGNKPILLDLFCGAGGATKGYQRAGFYVVGVDIKPQKNYCGDEFHQADALEYLDEHGREFDVIHASPPCKAHTVLRVLHPGIVHPDLIPQTREKLQASGLPYIIENVMGAPLRNPVMLCGTMFHLETADGKAELRRHRLFESSHMILGVPACRHTMRTIGVFGHNGGSSKRDGFKQYFSAKEGCEAMGIDWMNRDELSQAIPPAYSEFIGRKAIEWLNA